MSAFTVSGREINYNGAEFAVIVAPLSGRMRDGIDALNGVGYMDVDDWNEAVTALKAGISRVLTEELDKLSTELWMSEQWHAVIDANIDAALLALIDKCFYEANNATA